jgi:hypothetical protein
LGAGLRSNRNTIGPGAQTCRLDDAGSVKTLLGRRTSQAAVCFSSETQDE